MNITPTTRKVIGALLIGFVFLGYAWNWEWTAPFVCAVALFIVILPLKRAENAAERSKKE